MCYLYLRLMFWEVILMFHSIWWLLPLFEFWNVSWHSSLKRMQNYDIPKWLSYILGGLVLQITLWEGQTTNKRTLWEISLRKQPTFLDARHHWFHQEITWRTLKRSNSIHTDDAQLTTQIWTVLLIGWSKCLTNQKHYLCLGSDTSSARNFYLRSSDVILPEN